MENDIDKSNFLNKANLVIKKIGLRVLNENEITLVAGGFECISNVDACYGPTGAIACGY